MSWKITEWTKRRSESATPGADEQKEGGLTTNEVWMRVARNPEDTANWIRMRQAEGEEQRKTRQAEGAELRKTLIVVVVGLAIVVLVFFSIKSQLAHAAAAMHLAPRVVTLTVTGSGVLGFAALKFKRLVLRSWRRYFGVGARPQEDGGPDPR